MGHIPWHFLNNNCHQILDCRNNFMDIHAVASCGFTYVGLLHCLSLYLTPPPQVLLHSPYSPNSLQFPFTGVILLPSMHSPCTQIYYKISSMALCYVPLITYIGGSTACAISWWYISGCTRSSIGLAPQT